MIFRCGELVLIAVQFHQTPGSKVRPAVVILDSGDDDFVAAPITSRSRASDLEITLDDWKLAGLNVPSVARLQKLSVLSKASVLRVLGRMSETDLVRLTKALCRTYCPTASGAGE